MIQTFYGLATSLIILLTCPAMAQTTVLDDFNSAAKFFNDKEYANSAAAYERVAQSKSPLAPVAKIYEATALLKMNQTAKAKALISQVDIASLPPNLKKKALLLKNRLFLSDFAQEADLTKDPSAITPPIQTSQPKNEKAFSGLIDLAYGYNSNPKTLSDVSTSAVPGDQLLQARAFGDYEIDAGSIYDLKVDYSFAGTYFNHDHSSNYIFHDFTLPAALYLSSFRLRVTPEFYFDYYGGDAFSQSTGGAVDVSKRFGGSYVGLTFAHQEIKNLTSSYSYLTGTQNKIQASLQSQWSTSSTFVNAYSGKLNYQDTSTLTSSYAILGVNVGGRYVLGAFDFNLSFAYENHAYAKATSDNIARNDYKTFMDAQIGFSPLNHLRLYVDANTTDNRSNFDSSTNTRAYRQNAYLGGLSYSF